MYNWLTVNQLIVYHTLLTVCKIRHCGEPEYLAKFLQDDNRTERIIIHNTTLSLVLNSFVWRGAKQWNMLYAIAILSSLWTTASDRSQLLTSHLVIY
jgi:hypothetical protein